ncbi:protein CIP2A homolog L-like isoform X4 [Mytilus trossulus]|uniref:protein CIP2A homolog L-like isoform X4 n=1 Tax=Mytilus trossulus TaxID=6551 RepID=UPI0030073806
METNANLFDRDYFIFVTMETASCVKHVIMAANQYKNSKTDGNLVYLQRQLEILVGSLSSRTSTLKFFNLRNLLPVECLNAVIDILRESRDLKPGLLSKCISLFQHLAQDSEIREAFHDSFHLTQCLATVIKTHAGIPGDHLTVEILNVLQRITYGHKINFQDSYVEDLLHFVLKNITNPITEFTLPCLGLLVNLCRDNFATQSYIKNMEGSRNLYKTLMSYLDDQNLTMMIFTLSCISYLCLHQDIGQHVFNPKNVKRTFQLMFNIVLKGDTGTTRQYAVDLFSDLLKNQNIQQSLVEFEKLSSSIEKVLNLVATSTAESVVKIFELLLSLSAIEGIRPIICRCILSTCSVQQRDHYAELAQTPVSQIKEPLFAVVHWASQPAESHDQASLYAIDFLAEFYEEMIYSNTRIQYSAHADLVLPLTLQALSTRIEGESHIMKRISRKIIKALQLSIVLTGEEDIKRKLVGMVDMQMFSKLLDFQFSNNKVALNSSKFTLVTDDLSDIGVEIVMYGLDLMAKLAKNLPEVDALFSSSLQDSRIVPFLSAGLTSDNRTVVQVTLQIICFASMFDAFPTVLLGDALTASNCKKKEELMKRETIQSPVQYHMPVLHSYENKENINHDASRISIQDATRLSDQDASVQSLIDRMQSGFEGANSSEIIDLYEHKIQSLQTKEEQLQDLLEAKSLALTQADRLIAQHRSRKAAYEAEAAKMRRLLHSSEINSEKCKEEINEIKLKKEHLQNSLESVMEEKSQLEQVAEEHQQLTAAYTELSEKYTSVDKSLLSLKQEHKTLSEMHEVLRKHDENLKEQCDSASEQLSKLEAERKTLNKTLKEKESKLSELTKTHTKLQKDFKTSESEREQLEEAVDKYRANMAQLEQTKKQFQHQVSSLELLCRQHETNIDNKDKELVALKGEVDKHRQIAALINSLSSGKSENGAQQ